MNETIQSQGQQPKAERQAGRGQSFPRCRSIAGPARGHATPLRRRMLHLLLLGSLAACLALRAPAQTPQTVSEVSHASLEDLMNMTVTSVSKRAQTVADSAAAVFVITQQDIQRSGATSVPELLRMVPGLEVARIDENKWAIASRGFNGRFDNKLLVLIDGRSVYTPLFSGVFWNLQDIMLEDVERIEVIRGPGATLWGANAVDGVINIITKPAKETQSDLVTAGGGNEELGSIGARHGGKLGQNTDYRVYGKYFDWGPSIYPSGETAHDGWNASRGGFRADWAPHGPNSLTVQGDIDQSRYDETLTIPQLSPPYSSTFPNSGNFSGGDLLARWTHTADGSSMSLQTYYDNRSITDNSLFADREGTFDADFQDQRSLGESQQLVWGLGYRSIRDRNTPSFTVALQPNHENLNLFSAFVQDEIGLFDRRLSVTIGSKLEHNDFTGFEVEPNIRFLWMVNPRQSVWTAVSRAVRTPAITEEGLQLNSAVIPPGTPPSNPTPLPEELAVFGSTQFRSEDLVAYELGYRAQATNQLSFDVATFYNDYSNLRSAEPAAPFVQTTPAPTHIVVPFIASNKMGGGTYGGEVFSGWKVTPRWQLLGWYSYLHMNIQKNADSLDPTPDNPDGWSPRQQWYLRSSFDLPLHLEQDTTLRFVDRLPGLNIPSYYSLDGHLGWSPVPTLRFSLNAANLLNDKHLEFIPDFINTAPTEVKRTFYVSFTWRM